MQTTKLLMPVSVFPGYFDYLLFACTEHHKGTSVDLQNDMTEIFTEDQS
jgi:hypothetical protein